MEISGLQWKPAKNEIEMKYKDEDIAFAHKILSQRNELDEQEVESWLRVKGHVELLNELALEKDGGGQEEEEEARKSRQMTLRWSLTIAVVLIIVLIISKLVDSP